MINISKKIKTVYFEEINISKKYLIESYLEDYGEDCEKQFTKNEEEVRIKYFENAAKKENYKGHSVKIPMRLFCRDCHYYSLCKGKKWEIGCKYKKYFFEITKGGEKNEQ